MNNVSPTREREAMNATPAEQDQWSGYDRFQKRPAPQEYYSSIIHNLVAAIKSLRTEKFTVAIDLASGCGTSTYPLLQVAKSVIGVDASPSLVKVAKENNTHPNVQFVCERVEDYVPQERADLVTAAWLVNYSHKASDLAALIQRIHSILYPGGCVCLVVPSASFFSPQVQQVAREAYDFEVAALSVNRNSTVGIFSFANEWIKTTVWQPLHIMRVSRPWFDLHEWDVKGTLVRDNLLPELDFEPPYTVLYGRRKEGE